ncbi:MAG: Gfo/Idh/MocA family oxidoreductase [Chloroflexi bacterium]|nr:Gfo/Idh/MocA family oxidoreductase [Chloroflexota bacterium]
MSEEYGVAVIGYGRAGGAHIRAAQQTYGARLVGLAEVSVGRREEAAKQFDCLIVEDYHDLLRRSDVHIVAIALPHWLHERVAIEAAQAGKHLLIEKPLAMEPEECDRINAAVEAAGTTLMVAHSQHYNPFNQTAHQLIEEGAIGDVVFQTVNWYKPLGLASRPPWGMDRSKGGGMLQMNGAHVIDVCRWFANSPILSVSGHAGNDVFGDRVKADDSFAGIIRFRNGRVAAIAHVAYEEGVETYVHDVIGTRGQLRVASYPPVPGLWINRNGAFEAVSPQASGSKGITGELQDLVACLRERRPVPIPGTYGREIVAAMSALERSSRELREVPLP